MKMLLYPKLAASNIRKNAKTYLPYLLTSSIMIMMFYIILSLSGNESYEGSTSGYYLSTIMAFGAVVIGIFSLIFLFYTNSFLIKQRKKEFGLYSILGMEKRHIFLIMLFETIYLFIISLITGLILGISFNKLCFLLLQRLITNGVMPVFEISVTAIGITAILFSVIFLLTLLYNLLNIQLASPVQLLRGGNEGEQEPKTQWLSAIIGFAAIIGGYYIANTVEKPLDALLMFFVAVFLVIIGTYNLFLSGSILLLKLLRKNKKYYYKTSHFISVSGMIYRMKQNATGLASICILATAVLVIISGTLSLYLGMDDAIKSRVPNDITINTANEDVKAVIASVNAAQAKANVSLDDEISYSYFSLGGVQQGESFDFVELSDQNNNNAIINILLVPLGDYNQIKGTNFELEKDEILFGSEVLSYDHEKIEISGLPFSIKSRVESDLRPGNIYIGNGARYFVVVKDTDIMSELHRAFMLKSSSTTYRYQSPSEHQIMHFYGFNLSNTDEEKVVYDFIFNDLKEKGVSLSIDSRELRKAETMEMYGGFLFLGIFLSILFIIATTLIIYYKQITEGYDDKLRYNIMLKVGLSKKEIKQTIKSQILLTFFLPLIAASIHIIAAFKLIRLLLNLLFLYNTSLFAICTVGTVLAFSLAYALIYIATSKIYYSIVSDLK